MRYHGYHNDFIAIAFPLRELSDTITVDRFVRLLPLHWINMESDNKITEMRDEMPLYVKHGIIWNIGGYGTMGCMSVIVDISKYTTDDEFLRFIQDLNICISTGVSPGFLRFYFANIKNFLDLPTEQYNNDYITLTQALEDYSQGPLIKYKVYSKLSFIIRINEALNKKYIKLSHDQTMTEYEISEDLVESINDSNKTQKTPSNDDKADNKSTNNTSESWPLSQLLHPLC